MRILLLTSLTPRLLIRMPNHRRFTLRSRIRHDSEFDILHIPSTGTIHHEVVDMVANPLNSNGIGKVWRVVGVVRPR
jgi:hypothetical protein